MTPSEVGRCSLWQFNAAVSGWIAANSPEDADEMSAEAEDDIWKGVVERMGS